MAKEKAKVEEETSWQPPDDAVQDTKGIWRWKAGTVDTLGRSIGGWIVPGQPKPLNPSGRSYGEKEIVEKATDYAPDMIEVLYNIALTAKNPAVRVSAANSILDRALGKPASKVINANDDGTIPIPTPIVISQEVIDKIKKEG